MLIRTGYDIAFDTPAPTPIVLLVSIHPDRAGSLQTPERFWTEPELPYQEFVDTFGNRAFRVVTAPGVNHFRGECVVEDSGLPDEVNPDAPQLAVQDLPHEVLPFLLPSRYCEVDRLSDLAWQLFPANGSGWDRVQAICAWVHKHIEFGYQYARPTKTAFEVLSEQQGVCRDFMHLAVAFCRAVNIPARYATGYLGDIGVPPAPSPMDFSAWFEVYLGGRWYTFDARHNEPRIGRILLARGRDAADVAISTSFGPARLARFEVITDELVSQHSPSAA
jgi:transglutaminase-like putative cysteine protease